MSAGLPGLGLGGLFFIFSALLAPFPELWRTLRGRSDHTRWKAIGRQLAQALTMIAAIDLTLRLAYLVLSAAGIGNPPAADQAVVLPLGLIGITTGLLVLVLCGAKLAELGLGAAGGRLPRVPEVLPQVAPLRTAALGAVAVIAWIALLVLGASELSPLERPHREQIASRPERGRGPEPRRAAAKLHGQDQGDRSSFPAAIEASPGVRDGAAGTSGAPVGPDAGGTAEAAPAPAPAVPIAEAPASKPAPPASKPPATPAGPAPAAAPNGGSAAAAPSGSSPKPESTGPPESAPASEATPAAEPPPQAPAKGLRDLQ